MTINMTTQYYHYMLTTLVSINIRLTFMYY